MKGYQSLFGRETQNYLYPFFWQHGEEHEVLDEYVEKIYASSMRPEDRLLSVDVPAGAHSIFVVFEAKKGAAQICRFRGAQGWSRSLALT